MNSLEGIIAETRKGSNLCQAVERGGILCFKDRTRRKNGQFHSRFCSKHQNRFTTYKYFDLPEKIIKKCKFIDCNKVYFAKNYCERHYEKYITVPRNKLRKCFAEGCGNNRCNTHKYCSKHFNRIRKYKTLEGSGLKRGEGNRFKIGNTCYRAKEFKVCIVPECNLDSNKSKIKKGLCNKHYLRWWRYKDYNISSKKQFSSKQQELR